MSSKKGMIGMMETILIIFVIFIIIGLGMYFFFKFYAGSIEERAQQTCMLTSTQQLLSITNMPQIQCSFQSIPQQNCIDIYKLWAFSQSRDVHLLREGNCPKEVHFEIIYPKPSANKTCDLQDILNPNFPDNCNLIELYTPPEQMVRNRGKIILTTPVSLYFPEKSLTIVGKLIIGAYQWWKKRLKVQKC